MVEDTAWFLMYLLPQRIGSDDEVGAEVQADIGIIANVNEETDTTIGRETKPVTLIEGTTVTDFAFPVNEVQSR